ncbi:hypothetical protein DPMN_157330 [Dreissena polymorpha]|uniref:NACHT domain-containing protein n=2 Tax=Dreissena polymorpha TaxID=45954 RepID=A0A9D4INS0_DREPO|nr:hypothetical protein DPMN_157330 [Dreissena polymorpha]
MSQLLQDAHGTLNDMKQVADESMKEMKAFVKNFYKKHAARDNEDYERAVEDFVRQLKQHYKVTLSHVSISTLLPSGDESLYKLYAAPSICRIAENIEGNKTEHPVTTYKEILCTDGNEKLNKRIYLQGEAGIGKSTFASKLVLDWCNLGEALSSPSKTFIDASTLREFKIILFITLRDAACERDVTKMIKEQILDLVYPDTNRKVAYELLNKIMQKEICLVVQDGLDEWMDPQGKLAQPILVSSYSQCTLLTTTRPWKLTDERIKKSQISSLFKLKGVSDPYELCDSVLKSLGCKTSIEFKEYVADHKLYALLVSPMFLSLIVSSWVDGMRLTGSGCELYTVLIDGLFKKASEDNSFFDQPPFMCFQNTRYLNKNLDFLQAISKTAYLMLFTAEREQFLVISDRRLSQYLTREQKNLALKTGVLTESKCVNRTYLTSTCSFIHKSVQEFLAAVHIAGNSDALLVVSRHFAQNSDRIFKNQVFTFLCGLNISSANKLSRTIDSILNTNASYKSFYLLDLYISGFIEAQVNGQNRNDIDLKLSGFYLHNLITGVKLKAFLSILQMNKSNAKLLICNGQGELWLDLSSFRNLETLHIPNATLQPNSLQGLKKLTFEECECVQLDLSSFHNLESLELSGRITFQPNAFHGLAKLKELKLGYCQWRSLNLSSCDMQKSIELSCVSSLKKRH